VKLARQGGKKNGRSIATAVSVFTERNESISAPATGKEEKRKKLRKSETEASPEKLPEDLPRKIVSEKKEACQGLSDARGAVPWRSCKKEEKKVSA